MEKAAGGFGKPGTKTLLQILQDAIADEKLARSAHWSDANKIRDGILQRAPEEMIKYASQFTVSPDQLEEKVAELVNFVGEYSTRCVDRYVLGANYLPSILHGGCSAPGQGGENGLLPHAQRHIVHFPLEVHRPPVP